MTRPKDFLGSRDVKQFQTLLKYCGYNSGSVFAAKSIAMEMCANLHANIFNLMFSQILSCVGWSQFLHFAVRCRDMEYSITKSGFSFSFVWKILFYDFSCMNLDESSFSDPRSNFLSWRFTELLHFISSALAFFFTFRHKFTHCKMLSVADDKNTRWEYAKQHRASHSGEFLLRLMPWTLLHSLTHAHNTYTPIPKYFIHNYWMLYVVCVLVHSSSSSLSLSSWQRWWNKMCAHKKKAHKKGK